MSPSDEELERRLVRLTRDADPVPSLVLEAGRAALGWRRLDAELAELLADSAQAPASASFALTRSVEAATRSVTFATPRRTIDLDIAEHGGRRTLRGQLSPAVSADVEVQGADGSSLASVRCDGLGRFLAELSRGGTVRLRITGDPDVGTIETAWVGV